MQNSRSLALWHYWVAFATFLPAVLLGAWQMLMRSPLPAPLDDPVAYYASVTLHGTVMAYVLTTFFIMGFGYAVAATSLGRPVRGMTAAWIGFAICLIGAVMAALILTARLNNIDPKAWLADVFARIADMPQKPAARVVAVELDAPASASSAQAA